MCKSLIGHLRSMPPSLYFTVMHFLGFLSHCFYWKLIIPMKCIDGNQSEKNFTTFIWVVVVLLKYLKENVILYLSCFSD